MGFLWRLFGSSDSESDQSDATAVTAPAARISRGGDRLQILCDPAWSDLEVAGESYHRAEIERLFTAWQLPRGGVTMRVAELVPEPSNKFDPNAIMVVVEREHVGYVPAEAALAVGRMCLRAAPGNRPACRARIWADPRDGLWRARVTLAFSGSEEPERDFALEESEALESQRRWRASREVGQVAGHWWADHKAALAELKRQGRLEEGLALANECALAAERVARALGERPDPWPVEQQSIILRKMKRPVEERAALEHYAALCGESDVPDKILTRLLRARITWPPNGSGSI